MITILIKTRVSAHTVEAIISVMMGLLGLSAVYVFYQTMLMSSPDIFAIVLILLILLLVALLGVILVLVRIWERLDTHKH